MTAYIFYAHGKNKSLCKFIYPHRKAATPSQPVALYMKKDRSVSLTMAMFLSQVLHPIQATLQELAHNCPKVFHAYAMIKPG